MTQPGLRDVRQPEELVQGSGVFEETYCDEPGCEAVNAPSTPAEYRVAYEHWRWHGYLDGCSHGS